MRLVQGKVISVSYDGRSDFDWSIEWDGSNLDWIPMRAAGKSLPSALYPNEIEALNILLNRIILTPIRGTEEVVTWVEDILEAYVLGGITSASIVIIEGQQPKKHLSPYHI